MHEPVIYMSAIPPADCERTGPASAGKKAGVLVVAPGARLVLKSALVDAIRGACVKALFPRYIGLS